MNPLYNQPANSQLESSYESQKDCDTKYCTTGGMTKLEAFTMASMQAYRSRVPHFNMNSEQLAHDSIKDAKAVLDELAKEQGIDIK